jgi:tetratricopeptide (TPR) repeat protein
LVQLIKFYVFYKDVFGEKYLESIQIYLNFANSIDLQKICESNKINHVRVLTRYANFMIEKWTAPKVEILIDNAYQVCQGFFQGMLNQKVEPAISTLYFEICRSYYNLGVDYEEDIDRERIFQKAVQIYRQFEKYEPELFCLVIANSMNNLGLTTTDFDDKVKIFLECIEIRKTQIKIDKRNKIDDDPFNTVELSLTYYNLGDVYAREQNFLEAKLAYEECYKIRTKLSKTYADTVVLLADCAYFRAGVLTQLKEYKLAQKLYLQALDIYKKHIVKDPKFYKSEVFDTMQRLIEFYQIQGLTKTADQIKEEQKQFCK